MTLTMKSLEAEIAQLRGELASHGHEQRPPLTHTHEVPVHSHPLPIHEHPQIQRNVLGQVRGALRGVLAVFETGTINTEQRKAIHALRVTLGDAYGSGCIHENAVYEQNDRLICQDCREDITEVGGESD